VSDLAAFLAERLDEDEAAAKAAIKGGKPEIGTVGQWNAYLEGGDDGWAVEHDAGGKGCGIIGDRAIAEHIARHDPARALREVQAKRSITEAHDREHYCPLPVLPGRHGQLWTPEEGPCWTLLLLAAVWSDHPDYRETEWKP
jgi:hypothetical protein